MTTGTFLLWFLSHPFKVFHILSLFEFIIMGVWWWVSYVTFAKC